MSQIPVKVVTCTNQVLHHLRELMKTLHDDISQRAFCLYRQHGCQEGHTLEDWSQAEREVLFRPPCELVETKDTIRITAAAPGFDVFTLQVDVLPDSITLEGRGERHLLRQLDLPARIDPDETRATFEGEVLRVVARKASAAASPTSSPDHRPFHRHRANLNSAVDELTARS